MNELTTNHSLSPAAELYVWGYPLVCIQRTRRLLCSKTPSATLNHIDDLATPNDKAIVVPNNDTLYSSAWYDLRHGDLTIDVPPMDHPNRYWNVMVVDAYSNVAYVCRRHHGTSGTTATVTLDPDQPPTNDGSTRVTLATPTAWVIIRVLVESDADLPKARELQRSIRVQAPIDHPQELTERAGRATDVGRAGADFFEELADCLQEDPPAPWHPTLSAEARQLLENPEAIDPAELAEGVKQGNALIARGNQSDAVLRNGWSTGRAAEGFGNDPLKRAIGTMFGLGGHQAIENRTYVAQRDAEQQPLDGKRGLILRFAKDQQPPCSGFWSITAYGSDMYLVENELKRYSISDRTPNLHYDADGSLSIQLSAQRPTTPVNWLPVPEGPYLMGLRVYEGLPEVVDCDWFPPALTAVTQAQV